MWQPQTTAELEWMMQKRPTREYVSCMRAYMIYKEALEAERNKQADEA